VVRPCGACRSYVPADTGCEHWLPGLSGKAAESRELRRVAREQRAARRAALAAEVAEFQRVFQGRTTS
jgi:hypothetical protein